MVNRSWMQEFNYYFSAGWFNWKKKEEEKLQTYCGTHYLMGYVCVSNTIGAVDTRLVVHCITCFWYSFPLIMMIIRKMAIFILHPCHNHYILRGKMQPIRLATIKVKWTSHFVAKIYNYESWQRCCECHCFLAHVCVWHFCWPVSIQLLEL